MSPFESSVRQGMFDLTISVSPSTSGVPVRHSASASIASLLMMLVKYDNFVSVPQDTNSSVAQMPKIKGSTC